MNPPGSLDPPPEELRKLAIAAFDLLDGYYRSLPTLPVMPVTSSISLVESLGEPAPAEGADPAALLKTVRDRIFPNCRNNAHPRFFGYIASPGNPVSAVAEYLASGLNANVTSWRSAPAATELEHIVTGWIKDWLGFPPTALGLLVSGGSAANLAGLAAARAVKGGIGPDGVQGERRRMRVYAGEEAHFSVTKAAAILGIGEANVTRVPLDDRRQMDLRRLRECVEEDARAGHLPICVVATAGSTATGAVDRLDELAGFARTYGLWLHVDAAYGGFAALAPSVRPLLTGIGEADSIALDPHKWLYAPTGCGCVLYRDPAAARASFGTGAEYIRPIGVHDAESFAFWDYGPELSRSFRALGLWLLIKTAGTNNLGRAIESNIACAKHLEKLVEQSADFEMLAPVGLSVFCFRYKPPGYSGDLDALNERTLIQLQRDGGSYLSNARVGGNFALRGCVVNYRTAEPDMEALLEDVRRAGIRSTL